jgi:hypothetical protein
VYKFGDMETEKGVESSTGMTRVVKIENKDGVDVETKRYPIRGWMRYPLFDDRITSEENICPSCAKKRKLDEWSLFPPGLEFGKGLLRKPRKPSLEENTEEKKNDTFSWQAIEFGEPPVLFFIRPMSEEDYWSWNLRNGSDDAYSDTNIEGVAELFHTV